MYKITASDLDGTLLASNHRILPYTKKVLNDLHEQGKEFVFATGRHHIDVAQMREEIGIPAFMITSNGAQIHNADNEVVFQQNLPSKIVSALIKLLKDDKNLKINIYRNDDWLVNTIDDEETCVKNHFPHSLFDTNNPPVENVVKIFLIHKEKDHEKLAKWETQLNEQFSGQIHVTFSSYLCLEIMDAGVSKGHALKEVAKIKGYQLEDCIAFGDGMNDAEMLTMAGKGVLMGTAHYKVKEVLPNIELIGNSDDESVAHYLVDKLLDDA